jgi:hypothetical protein
MTKNLTAAEVREWLDYDPATGVLTWKKNPCPRGKNRTGQRAGCRAPNGYRLLRIGKILHREHAVAWLHVYGVWPGELDHINRDPGDNRIANLREATSAQNKINAVREVGATGYRGVRYIKRLRIPYEARISHNNKTITLGYFPTAEEASATVIHERRKQYGGFVDPALWVCK